MDTTFATALQTFVNAAQTMIDKYMAETFPNLDVEKLTVEPGRRYVRIVKSSGPHSRYVYCFVDVTNGDILKAASWKAPAKHARGNIFNLTKVTDSVSPYGANYMR